MGPSIVACEEVTVRTPTFSVEVIAVPVSDVERALRFYVDQVGFTLDVDYSPNDAFRVVQLTPPGSSCSIQIGKDLTDAPVGSLRNVYLVVTDIEAARNRLLERGVEVGEIRHRSAATVNSHREHSKQATSVGSHGFDWALPIIDSGAT